MSKRNGDLCARCGERPRNSTLKSYCVECKREIEREAYHRRGGRIKAEQCSRCKQPRQNDDGAHPSYCRDCYRAKRAEQQLRLCSRCGTEPRVDASYCKTCRRAYERDYRTKNPQKPTVNCSRCGKPRGDSAHLSYCPACFRDWTLTYKFGIVQADYDAMLAEQGGTCKICRRPRKLVVDHCHKTGVVRGLLCAPCNSILGQMCDDPALLRRAAEYLELYSS